MHSVAQANKFIQNLKIEISKIPFMPYRFRKNTKLNQNNVRELIFKGYVVVFCIYCDYIEILAIFKHNQSKFKN